MVNFVIGLECFGICLTFVALLLLLNGDGAREQKLLIFIMCGSLVQNVGYLLELTAPTWEAAVAAVTVENVGSAFVPLCYLHTLTATPARPEGCCASLALSTFLYCPQCFSTGTACFTGNFSGFPPLTGFTISVSPMAPCTHCL